MKSKIPDDLLSAFVDREATPDEESAAQAHLKASPQARQEVEDYERLSECLRGLPRHTAPPEFVSAVMQQAERETLIPLDSAGAGNRFSDREPLSRRAWVLTALGTLAAAAAVLFVVTLTGPKKEAALAVNDLSAVASRRDRSPRSATAAPVPPVADAGKFAAGVKVAELSPAAMAPKETASGSAPAASGMSAAFGLSPTSPEVNVSQLVLPTDLKTARFGDVIEALEKVGDQVAVVRLTVMSQTAGLGELQSLLVRDESRPANGAEKAKLLKEPLARRMKAVSVDGRKGPHAPGDLVCVFIEGSREEVASVLKDVQKESQFQRAQLTNTISTAMLEKYAHRTVTPQARQGGERSDLHARTVLSLPHAAVDKILADREPALKEKAALRKRTVPALAGNSDFSRMEVSPAKPSPTGVVPAQHAEGTSAKAGTRNKERQLVASAQRSYQFFFVLDDQSIAQSVSAAPSESASVGKEPAPVEARATAVRATAVRATAARARGERPTKGTHRAPVIAERPVRRDPPASEKRSD